MPLFGGFAQARNFGKGGAGRPPGFVTPAGSLGTTRGGVSVTGLLSAAAATGPGDPPITSYSIASGSLPTGLSFNTTTADITGTPNEVSSNTTTTFTVRAISSAGTIDREFSITIRPVIIAAYTSAGSYTFSVPVGTGSVEVLVIGAGGSGGHIGGGGGAGGVVYASSYPVTPGGSLSMNIGTPGGPYYGSYPPGQSGNQTTFGNITAYGGGYGGGYSGNPYAGGPGGSGGGGAHYPGGPGGSATQPGFSTSGVGPYTNYGNAGGSGAYPVSHQGAGGGGAGGGGTGWQQGYPYGGSGVYFPQYASYGTPGGHFAAGGGGGGWSGHIYGPGSGGTGGGGYGGYNSGGSNAAGHGSGGGAGGYPAPSGTYGSPGAVFIRY
jgi:hypothetical protein